MTHPAVLKARPFRRYSAILDSRTTAVCSACDNTVRPADDPWWQTHVPPLHHNCRSRIVTLSEAEAQREGVTPTGPDAQADKGFGDAPKPGKNWTPDLTEYPQPLVQVFHQPTKPKRPRKPKAPAPPAERPEGVKGQPFKPALAVDDALAGLRGHGLEPIDGRTLRASAHAITVPEKERLGFLNGVLEVLHDIRDRFPYWYRELGGKTKVCTYPAAYSKGGIFTHRERAVLVTHDDPERWAHVVERHKLAGDDPATLVDERQGWSKSTARHELAHALDIAEAFDPVTFGFARFSHPASRFNELWAAEARAAGRKGVEPFVREKVSDYATKNAAERFAETVMMATSPDYTAGMLPSSVERYVLELLEKGGQP
jgi:hypothetical protein